MSISSQPLDLETQEGKWRSEVGNGLAVAFGSWGCARQGSERIGGWSYLCLSFHSFSWKKKPPLSLLLFPALLSATKALGSLSFQIPRSFSLVLRAEGPANSAQGLGFRVF